MPVITTASIDINYLGLPIFIILNGATLNMSPAIEKMNIQLIPEHLKISYQQLMLSQYPLLTKYSGDSIFFLDPSLDKWMKFINNSL